MRKRKAATNELFEAQDCDEKLTINETYAKKFEAWKNREEIERLSKLQREASENFTDSENSAEDSEREEEDSDAELVTKEVGAKVLETISRISLGKREIYDPERSFFDEEDFIQDEGDKKVPEESLTEGAEALVKDEEEANGMTKTRSTPGYEQEQKGLREAFLAAANTQSDEEDDDFLSIRKKTERDKSEEELSFQEFLKERAFKKASVETELLERYFQANENLDDGEAFLRDYILFEGWKEGSKMSGNHLSESGQNVYDENEDESNLQDTEAFEGAYNFRFEEGASSQITGHAREVLDSVRQKDNKRRRKRLERLERKKGEKEEKRRELDRLKEIKRRELISRLETIQRIAGVSHDLDLSKVNLDDDFDEKEHEAQMKAILGEDFDDQEEAESDPNQLLKVPEELNNAGAEVVESKEAALSARQRKKIAKLEMQKQKRQKQEINDGEAYAPINVDDTQEMENREAEEAEAEETIAHPEGEPASDDPESLWFMCDGCGAGIPSGAKRYDCLSCDNFTLCSKCLTSVRHPHQLTRKRVPKHCKPPVEYLKPVGYSEFGRVLASETDDKQRAIVQSIVEDYYALDFEDIIGGDLPTRFKYASVPPADYGLSIDNILSKSDKELNQIISLKKLAPYREDQGRSAPRHRNKNNYACGSPNGNPTAKIKRKLPATDEERKRKKQRELEVLNSAVPSGVDSARLAAYGFREGKKKQTSAHNGNSRTDRTKKTVT